VVDVENVHDALDRIDPIPWDEKKEKQTILNRIGEASSLFRDKKLLEIFLKRSKLTNEFL
jgi:hypothetical protein